MEEVECRVRSQGFGWGIGCENKGYIALMSAIIVSAILLVISVSLGVGGFFSRFNVLDKEYKQKSQALAEGCLQAAMVKWALNPNFSAGNINIGGDICTIASIQNNTPVVGQLTIQTSAVYHQAVTNIKEVVKNIDLSLVSIINF